MAVVPTEEGGGGGSSCRGGGGGGLVRRPSWDEGRGKEGGVRRPGTEAFAGEIETGERDVTYLKWIFNYFSFEKLFSADAIVTGMVNKIR